MKNKVFKSLLTDNEKNVIVGGEVGSSGHGLSSQDVDNANFKSGCTCTYNNQSAILNTNRVDNCGGCTCTKN